MSETTKSTSPRRDKRKALAGHLLSYLQDELSAPVFVGERLMVRILDLLSRRYSYRYNFLFNPRHPGRARQTGADARPEPFPVSHPERLVALATALADGQATAPWIRRSEDGRFYEMTDPHEDEYRTRKGKEPRPQTRIYREKPRSGGRAYRDQEDARSWLMSIRPTAFEYLASVLLRRVQVANRSDDGLSCMHKLTERLCACGPIAAGWQHVRFSRADRSPPKEVPAHFEQTAKVLAALTNPPQEKNSTVAGSSGTHFKQWEKGRRAIEVPTGRYSRKWLDRNLQVWLSLGDCAAQVPEELNLFEVLQCVPVPLGRTLDKSAFDALWAALDTLDERYGRLVACGLDPARWLAETKPTAEDLKELHVLMIMARENDTGPSPDWPERLRLAFDKGLALAEQKNLAKRAKRTDRAHTAGEKPGEPRAIRPTFTGFGSFSEFMTSEIGNYLLYGPPRSLDEPDATDTAPGEPEQKTAVENEPAVPSNLLEYAAFPETLGRLLDLFPAFANDPVLRYCTGQLLLEERSWYPPLQTSPDDDRGILCDAMLRTLLRHDPVLRDANDGTIVDTVAGRLVALVKKAAERGFFNSDDDSEAIQ